MKKERGSFLESFAMFLALTIIVVLFVVLANVNAKSSNASSVVLYSGDYTEIETFHDSDYVIKVTDEKSVTVIDRETDQSKTYGWSHVIRISE